jgi:hypothetical protein
MVYHILYKVEEGPELLADGAGVVFGKGIEIEHAEDVLFLVIEISGTTQASGFEIHPFSLRREP